MTTHSCSSSDNPRPVSDGSLYLTAMGGGNGWGLRRVDPASGNVLWNYSPWPSNGMSAPSVGPNGSVYFSRSSPTSSR